MRSSPPEQSPELVEALAAWVETRAQALALADGDDPIAAEFEVWIDATYEIARRSESRRSIELLERAVELTDRLPARDSLRANTAKSLIQAYLAAGELEAADRQVKREGERFGGSWMLRPNFEFLGVRVARAQGRWQEALEGSRRLLADGALRVDLVGDPVFGSVGISHRRLRGQTLCEAARIELELGRLDVAANFAQAALELALEAGDPAVELDANLALASLAYLREDAELTLSTVQRLVSRGLLAAEASEVSYLRGMALGGLALQGESEHDEPRRLLSDALERGGLGAFASLDAEWMAAELALDIGDRADAATWIQRSGERIASWESGDEAHSTLRLRYIGQAARLAVASGAPRAEMTTRIGELEAGLDLLLDSWDQAETSAGGVGFLESEERRGLLGELVRARAAFEGRAGLERAFDALLRAQAMGSSARREALPPGDLAAVRATLLDDGEGLLVYVVTGPTTHALAVDDGAIDHFELPGSRRLKATSEAFEQALNERLTPNASRATAKAWSDNLERLGRELGAALYPPQLHQRASDWKNLRVVGFEALRGVPFEALVAPTGALIGESLAVSNLPSIPVALDAANRRAARPTRDSAAHELSLLVHLEPSPEALEMNPGLQSVVLTDAELRRMTRRYSAERLELLAEPAPTPSDLFRALDRSAVVQVLAHGVLDPFRERGSGLVLAGDGADDGLLWPAEVDGLPHGQHGLLLLMSCGTSVGPRRTGDDTPANLAGAFLARGAASVVTTGAKLELSLALDLATALHEGLDRGHSTAEALRRARKQIAADDPTQRFELAKVLLLGSPNSPLARGAAVSAFRTGTATATLLAAIAVVALLVSRRLRRRDLS